MRISKEIFRQYDIRGIVGKDLGPDSARMIGRAFGVYLRKTNPGAKSVSVGRDVRLSSRELAAAVTEGLVAAGLDVCDIGVCPTPLQYFSLYHLNLDGGVMVTGSHNPPEYNGLKLSAGKDTIYGEAIQQIREILTAEDWGDPGPKGLTSSFDIVAAYREYMINEFSYLAGPLYKRLRVIVDAGNGTGGLVAPEILERAGCEVVPLYCEPDGNFPNHHPDPTVVEYIQDLIKQTRSRSADIGVGYDGDADRIGVVDGEGDIVWGDRIMIILARDILQRMKGAKVIGDVKCSQIMFDDIRSRGGTPIMWKTGHSLVKQKMRDEKAALAGEFSGHIFIADRYFGFDDAIYTTMRLIEIMKKTGSSLKELLSDVPPLCYTPEIRIDCPEEIKGRVVAEVVGRFVRYAKDGGSGVRVLSTDRTDGVRVVFEKGWGLVRVSNTQPVIVMRIEASDEQSLKLYREFLEGEVETARCEQQGGNGRQQ